MSLRTYFTLSNVMRKNFLNILRLRCYLWLHLSLSFREEVSLVLITGVSWWILRMWPVGRLSKHFNKLMQRFRVFSFYSMSLRTYFTLSNVMRKNFLNILRLRCYLWLHLSLSFREEVSLVLITGVSWWILRMWPVEKSNCTCPSDYGLGFKQLIARFEYLAHDLIQIQFPC